MCWMGWGRRVVRWSCSILRQPKTAPPRALQQAHKLDADECWAERAAGCVCSRGHCARRPASSPMQERGAARQGKQMHRFVHRQPVPLVRPRRRCSLYACVWPRCLALQSTARWVETTHEDAALVIIDADAKLKQSMGPALSSARPLCAPPSVLSSWVLHRCVWGYRTSRGGVCVVVEGGANDPEEAQLRRRSRDHRV